MARNHFSDGALDAYNVHGDEIRAGDLYAYKVVAVVSNDGRFWAAYRGRSDQDPEDIAFSGDKVDLAVARLLFPTIAATHTWNP